MKYHIGVNVTLEGGSNWKKYTGGAEIVSPKVLVSPGISFEAQLSKHSGIELDLNYRHLQYSRSEKDAAEFGLNKSWNENYISIPILYKYYSRIINFAVGPTFDFWVVGSNTPDKRFEYGLMLRVSKDIKLYEGLYIEPAVQINPEFSKSMFWWGVGVGLKYRF